MSQCRRERQPVRRSRLGSAKISWASCGSSAQSLPLLFGPAAAERIAGLAARTWLISIGSSKRSSHESRLLRAVDRSIKQGSVLRKAIRDCLVLHQTIVSETPSTERHIARLNSWTKREA